ncbi:MAG: primosomal protein N' [Mariprofundaceae bacterium]|nr:primosomal protein N' [Mariprofundaceae bacterium]
MDVAVFAPLPGTYTYLWPESLSRPGTGIRVLVPFGRGRRYGVVTGIAARKESDRELKAVLDRLDDSPPYDAARQAWLERLRRYYLAAPGEAWETALAWAGVDEKRRYRCLDREALQVTSSALADAFRTKAAVSLQTLRRRCPSVPVQHMLRAAMAAGVVEEVVPPAELLPHDTFAAEMRPVSLLPAQAHALKQIVDAQDRFQPLLLFGCTGSGKTEVYIRAAEAMVAEGWQVLILVPEIGLTPMWLSRLASRFAHIAVWHSGLTDRERIAVRHRLHDVDILIGTRSALFLPLPRLGLIVVDEEHDGSFKQQEGLAYSARDMAVLLGQEMSIPVVLGSATPSLESWRLAREGRYRLLELPERIRPHPRAAPEIIDMRGSNDALSDRLITALKEAREQGQQSLLFLNRRGYAPALQCTACGDVPQCPECSLNFTLHRRLQQLRCHACGLVRPVPESCAHCGESAFMPLGAGTEKLEELLSERVPELRFARFDRDSMHSRKRFEQTLAAFARGELDCLIGTQMLVKGHHFPNVTLVGIVHADQGLGLPDFRAGERWWQHMTQVAGRAGRGDEPGRILVQTYNPEAGWLAKIGDDDADKILDEELSLREQLHYPPRARWVRIIFSARQAEAARRAAEALAGHLHVMDGIRLSGPMPCALERLAGRYRYEMLLRDPSRRHLPWCLEPLLAQVPVPSGVRRKVDVDPLDMM